MRNDGREKEVCAHDARKRQSSSCEYRIRLVILRQIARYSRSYQKTDTEGDADKPKRLRPIFRLGDVGDVCLSDGQIACRQSIDNPSQEYQPQCSREAENQESDACADLAHQQDGPAADPVGQVSQWRSCDQLAERISRNQQPHDCGRGSQRFCVEGQKRQDNRQTKNVHKNNQKNGEQRRSFHWGGSPLLLRVRNPIHGYRSVSLARNAQPSMTKLSKYASNMNRTGVANGPWVAVSCGTACR